MSSLPNLSELPRWMKPAMTPLVIALAVVSVVTQALGVLTNPNWILIAYVAALLISTGWTVYAFRARTFSALLSGSSLPLYKRSTRLLVLASTLAICAALVFHVYFFPRSFVLYDAQSESAAHPQIVSLTTTQEGLDIKLKNSGADTAFVHEVWFAFTLASDHPAPCGADIWITKKYEYPFALAFNGSKVVPSNHDESSESKVDPRLRWLLKAVHRSDLLEGFSWAAEPLELSQAVAPKSVDRFLIAMQPDSGWRIGRACEGGLGYRARVILVYDKTHILVSDPVSFTLVRTWPQIRRPIELPPPPRQ